MRPLPVLAGPRIRLRVPRPGDAEAVHAYASDPDVTLYLSWPTHRGLADTQEWITRAIKGWAQGTDFAYVIEADGQVVGATGVTPVARHARTPAGCTPNPGEACGDAGERRVARLGYVLARHAWGKGYATEAVGVLTRTVLADPAVEQVEALVHPDNAASLRVLEKSGFHATELSARCGALPNLGGTPDVWTFVRQRDG